MPIRKTLRTIGRALRDADVARRAARDPEFIKGVQKDRRAALSGRFRTVRDAIKDREKIEKAKAAKKKKS